MSSPLALPVDLRLASDTPHWRPACGVRSLETLPVTFSAVLPAGG